MVNSSKTLLRLTRFVLLVATLLGYCFSLSAASQVGTCFPPNMTNSLERDMRAAETRVRFKVGVRVNSRTVTTLPQDDITVQTTERSPLPRDHFKQLLRSYYYTNPQSRGREELASFFSLSELYRIGPLSTNPDVDLPPPISVIERTEALCQRMVENLNTTPNPNDYCHWTYTCNVNTNRFPSLIINATECTARQGAKCVQRVTKMQTFTRTFSNDFEATWTMDEEAVSVIYAYTCRIDIF